MSDRLPDGRPLAEQPAWRQDFPIDWPEDQYVARRDFTKFLVLTSVAFVVGQFWIGGKNWLRGHGQAPAAKRSPRGRSRRRRLAGVPLPGRETLPAGPRLGQAEFVAYGQKCTHLSCAVVPRPEQGDLPLPLPRRHFDLRTGRPIAGPPPRPLPRIMLEIRDGDHLRHRRGGA